MSLGVNHRRIVRGLYKQILQVHKKLPEDLRKIGDQYVREEFKRHKNAEAAYVTVFMNQWKFYLEQIQHQIKSDQKLGQNLPKDSIDQDFNDSHIVQLYELKKAATNTSDK